MYSSGNYLSWPRRREWKTIIFPSQECKRFDDSIVNFLTNFLYRLFLPTKFVWLYDEYSILLLKSWSCVVTGLMELGGICTRKIRWIVCKDEFWSRASQCCRLLPIPKGRSVHESTEGKPHEARCTHLISSFLWIIPLIPRIQTYLYYYNYKMRLFE